MLRQNKTGTEGETRIPLKGVPRLSTIWVTNLLGADLDNRRLGIARVAGMRRVKTRRLCQLGYLSVIIYKPVWGDLWGLNPYLPDSHSGAFAN